MTRFCLAAGCVLYVAGAVYAAVTGRVEGLVVALAGAAVCGGFRPVGKGSL
jgi:hypothetical protein